MMRYRLLIDHDDDGDFDLSEDAGADVLSARWQLGLARADDAVAEPGRASIEVLDANGVYRALPPGRGVRLVADDGTMQTPLFTGTVQRVVASAPDLASGVARIEAACVLAQLARITPAFSPRVGLTAGPALAEWLSSAPVRHPALRRYWMLEQAHLGAQTRLAGPALALDLDPGQTRFALLGDVWSPGASLLAMIADVVRAERGRFYVGRAGVVVFRDRHAGLIPAEPVVSLADAGPVTLVQGDDWASTVTVVCHPRAAGPDGAIVWQASAAISLPPRSTRTFVCAFRTEDDRPTGAVAVRAPVAGVDYQANDRADGMGRDRTGQVRLSLQQVGFNQAEVQIDNPIGRTVYILAGARLLGQPITPGEPVQVSASRASPAARYGPRLRRLDLPLVDDLEWAAQIARYDLARRQVAIPRLRTLQLDGHAHRATLISVGLGDRVRLKAGDLAWADYHILRETHSLSLGGARHDVTWDLAPTETAHFWVLGQGHLDAVALAY